MKVAAVSHKHRLAAVYLASGHPPAVVAKLLSTTEGWVRRLHRGVHGFPELLAREQELHLARIREEAALKPFNLREAIEGQAKTVFDGKLELATQRDDLRVANAAMDSFLDRLVPKKQEKQERAASLHITVDHLNLIQQTMRSEGVAYPAIEAEVVEDDADGD